jgi:uncharacterized protein YbcC (UPF0753/DUF2309 family)
LHPLTNDEHFYALKFCQEILERKHFIPHLVDIQKNIHTTNYKSHPFQAVFCMDDRECGLRRHLELINPDIQTFGTAGHFGIECFYQSEIDPFPRKHCPLPIAPKVLIKEKTKKVQKIKMKYYMWLSNIILGSIATTFELLLKLLNPIKGNNYYNIQMSKKKSLSNLIRSTEESIMTNNHSVKQGYSFEEMARIVYEQLQIIGLTKNFAPLIFIIGHGSTSENNPYFTAYGCGACSGRPGGPNAVIFVTMANMTEVRSILKSKYHFFISEETLFIAGMHNTCSDTVTFFDCENINDIKLTSLKKFQLSISQACARNATERMQAMPNVTAKSIHPMKDPKLRSLSFFETRPEMGHTDLQFAIVGRRELTHNLDLKRKAFLQSYDSTIDLDGKILAKILTAVVPVCSGISLDYFFSRVDNLRFGAGSKLPQNIVGNIGTSHGTESDLLYGLPIQMVDRHTPLRLVIVVEQKPHIALAVLNTHPLVEQIIKNHWVYYFAYDWEQKEYYLFKNDSMIKYNLGWSI